MSTRVTRNSGGLDELLAGRTGSSHRARGTGTGTLRGLFVPVDADMMIHVLRNIGTVEVHLLPVDRLKDSSPAAPG